FGTEGELAMAVNRWRPQSRVNAEYWGVFAAAEIRLGNPVSAVHYLRSQRLTQGDDPLWIMSLADAEEVSGHADRAWNLRKLAWSILRKRAEAAQAGQPAQEAQGSSAPNLFLPPSATPLSQDAARVALSQGMANGDYSKALLVKLLSQEGRSPES